MNTYVSSAALATYLVQREFQMKYGQKEIEKENPKATASILKARNQKWHQFKYSSIPIARQRIHIICKEGQQLKDKRAPQAIGEGMPEDYQGLATIIASLTVDDQLRLVVKPDGWKGACIFNSLFNATFAKSTEEYTREARQLKGIASALAQLEAEGIITEMEGELCGHFETCRIKATTFAEHLGRVPTPAKQRAPQPSDTTPGQAIFERLIATWGNITFPSRDTVALGAQHLINSTADLPPWFSTNARYFDVYLALFSFDMYFPSNRQGTRALLRDPMRLQGHNNIVEWNQARFDSVIKEGPAVVTSDQMLRQLTHLSPISCMAFEQRLPKYTYLAPAKSYEPKEESRGPGVDNELPKGQPMIEEDSTAEDVVVNWDSVATLKLL
ncbi:hypothetical protein LTR17_007267 [Elasticomyces elasticus]|nr:hypothetical protein LTR17_007267 [Elasticomyces elasticus]